MHLKNVFITITIATLVGAVVYYYKPKEANMRLPFPYTTSVDPTAGISCEAMVGSLMFGSNSTNSKGITAELFKGTDKLAVQLDDGNKFNLITKASVEIGEAKSSDNWKVLQNNKNFLIATLSKFDESTPMYNYVDMFYLNKENGMGIWVKTAATSLFSDTPEAQSYLLKCR
ncbi:MAG: hypothetical protein ABID64_01105 [Nitrospirota bacterium]